MVLRKNKGSALTHDELDSNFEELINKETVNTTLTPSVTYLNDTGGDIFITAYDGTIAGSSITIDGDKVISSFYSVWALVPNGSTYMYQGDAPTVTITRKKA